MTFISRTAVESELVAGRLAESRVEGLEATREISLGVRHRKGSDARRGRVRRLRPRAPGAVIVRWGLAQLMPLLAELGLERPLLVTSSRFAYLDLPVSARFAGVRRHAPIDVVAAATDAAASADGLVGLGGGSAIDTAKAVSAATDLPLVAVPTTYAGSEWDLVFRR